MKKISLLLIVAIAVSLISGFGIKAATPGTALNLLTPSVSMEQGETQTFYLSIRNDGSSTLTDITVFSSSGSVSASANSPLSTLDPGDTGSISVRFTAPSSTVATSYTVGLEFSYTENGTPKSQTFSVNAYTYVYAPAEDITPTPTPTPTAEKTPKLALTSPASSVTATAGKTTSVNVTIKNIGNAAAKSINIHTPVNKDFVVSLPNKLYAFPLSENATKDFTLNITPDKDLKAGDYTVKFNYTFENELKKQFEGSCEIYVKIEASSDGAPNVVLSDFSVDTGKVVAGDNFTLDFTARNLGAKDAKGVQVTIDNLKTGELTTNNSSNSKFIGEIKGAANQKASFSLNASSKMKSGSYPVTFKVKYTDSADKEYTDTFTYYVNVTARDGASDGDRATVEITNITKPAATFGIAQDASVSVTITNSGTNTAKSVKITASPEDGIVPKSANIQMINSLNAGQSKILTFVFAPTADTKTRNYSIGFTVDYQTGELDEDDVSKTDQFMQYIGINVSNPEGDKKSDSDTIKSKPKIIISKYSLDPLIVQAGHEFDIDLTFQNTHGTKTVSNVTVSLSVVATETEQGNVFTPVDSSNIFYIESIGPKGTSEHHIRMYTVPDAKAKNYIITANFEYEDEDGNNLTSVAEFGVTVKQVTKLDVGDVYFPTQMAVGENQYLSFSVHNTGKVTLYNLKIKVEGEGIDNGSSEYIFGNFTSGSYDYYDGSFMPVTPGQTNLRLVISYDDAMGERIEIVEPYDVFIAEGYEGMGYDMERDGKIMDGQLMEFDEFGNPIDPNAKTPLLKNVWFWAGIGVALAVIIVVTVLVVRRRKQRKDLDFDE